MYLISSRKKFSVHWSAKPRCSDIVQQQRCLDFAVRYLTLSLGEFIFIHLRSSEDGNQFSWDCRVAMFFFGWIKDGQFGLGAVQFGSFKRRGASISVIGMRLTAAASGADGSGPYLSDSAERNPIGRYPAGYKTCVHCRYNKIPADFLFFSRCLRANNSVSQSSGQFLLLTENATWRLVGGSKRQWLVTWLFTSAERV